MQVSKCIKVDLPPALYKAHSETQSMSPLGGLGTFSLKNTYSEIEAGHSVARLNFCSSALILIFSLTNT